MSRAISRHSGASSRAVVAMGLAILYSLAPWWGRAINVTAAEEEEVPMPSSRSSATRATTSRSADTSRSTRTSDTGREARIEAKLDQILANQDQILTKLDQVMEELKIVKVRATVR